jgi:hypothetical protein
MGYVDSTGGIVNLSNLNVFEQTANYDSSTDSSNTYIYDALHNVIPISIGYNAGSLQGDYHHIDSTVPNGNVTWSRGPPIIVPGSQLWP